jgi:hypothetical protein
MPVSFRLRAIATRAAFVANEVDEQEVSRDVLFMEKVQDRESIAILIVAVKPIPFRAYAKSLLGGC